MRRLTRTGHGRHRHDEPPARNCCKSRTLMGEAYHGRQSGAGVPQWAFVDLETRFGQGPQVTQRTGNDGSEKSDDTEPPAAVTPSDDNAVPPTEAPDDAPPTQASSGMVVPAKTPAAAPAGLYSESFERAEFATSPTEGDSAQSSRAEFSCGQCQRVITSEYYTLNSQAFCATCKPQLDAALRSAGGSFLNALGYGLGAALLGAGVYYGIRAATGYELAIIAIGIGMVVGKAVRKGAGLSPHWIYRALGIGLTYVSVCLSFVPDVLKGSEMGASLGTTIVAFIYSLGIPILFMTQGEFIAIIIIGVGLWEGWRQSAPPSISLEGPFFIKAPAATEVG